jgi:hypothetical protein
MLVLIQRGLAKRHLAGNTAGWYMHLVLPLDQLDGRETQQFWALFSDVNEEYAVRLK